MRNIAQSIFRIKSLVITNSYFTITGIDSPNLMMFIRNLILASENDNAKRSKRGPPGQ